MMFRGEPSIWYLIPELRRLDGDLSIVFLSGAGVVFNQQMDDEWYCATVPDSLSYVSTDSGTQ